MQITTITQEKYSYLLRQIGQLSETMDIAGTLPSDDNKFLCVIGARENSNYGREVCEKLISGLAGYPIVIVSGLAIGIDSIAHEAALGAKLKTMSFPGSGLGRSVLYPKQHWGLAARIVESGGCLLSRFETNQPSEMWTFPVRNRLMAGVSHATLIIEARRGSGTLITAEYATEFGRDILAVPGPIFADLSYGPHMLIRGGATPITCSADILQALGFKIARTDGIQSALPNFAEQSLTPDEREIVNHLRLEILTGSKLLEKTGFSSSKLNTIISGLELQGIIVEREGHFKLA